MNFHTIFHIFLRILAILVDFGTPNGAGFFSRRACGDPLQFLLELTRRILVLPREHLTTREGDPRALFTLRDPAEANRRSEDYNKW